ncbi:MAG TPA: amino acid permease [Vicinamibacteria bacterium]|nr:amino acid permease [Vicinamibacteria bacterium]
MNSLFRRKSLDVLIAQGGDEAHGLKKTLTAIDLIALGIGAIIGAGIFATLGSATSGGAGLAPAGPGVAVSILLTAVACGFCALCYAEFASLVPVAGSAYTYSYATLGELVAWIIGWDLILEYAVGNIAVAISWAAYFRQLMAGFGIEIPAWLCTDLRSTRLAAEVVSSSGIDSLGPEAAVAYQAFQNHPTLLGIPIVCNIAAVVITALITWLLVVGVKESARFNNVIVVLKVLTLFFFIAVGAFHMNNANFHPFFPGGFTGVWRGASLIFFAYIGFDAISTAAEECQQPARDMPRGIIGSLIICTLLYIATALVLCGMIPYSKLIGVADPLAAALSYVEQGWAAGILAFGAVVAMTAVLLVFQLGQPRILMAMSRDGLLGPWFGKIHPVYRTPHVTTILTGVFVGFFAAVANIDVIVELTNIGTLFAFILVCIGILILRHREPERPRKFRVPFVPFTPLAGIASCLFLMSGLPVMTWIRFALWLVAGLVIYFTYSRRRSRVGIEAA